MWTHRLGNRIVALTLFACVLVTIGVLGLTLNTPTASADGDPERVAFGSDLVIAAGETVNGDVSVTSGDLMIGGTVLGDAVVVNGNAIISGVVRGDVVVTGGNVTLSEASEVAGNIVYLGGQLSRHEGAQVGGEVTHLDLSFGQLGNAIPMSNVAAPASQPDTRGLGLLERLSSLTIWSVVSMGVLALAVALLLAFPGRVRVSGATLESEGGPSVVVGLITAGLLAPLVGLLTSLLMISMIGWVLIPVLWTLVGAALVFGLVTVSLWLGRRVYDTAHSSVVHAGSGHTGILEKVPPLMFQMLLGIAVLLLSVVVPAALMPGWVGAVMLGLVYTAACIGLGATILSRLGTLTPTRSPRRSATMQQHHGAGHTAPLSTIRDRQRE